MSYFGRLALEHIDSLLDDADFWVRWVDRLHPDEKSAIAKGEIGVIKRPFSPDWVVGEWMEVASNLWLKPQAPRYTHRGWRIHFDLRDFRVVLPRRTPGLYEPPDLDALGYPIAHDAEAIEAARVDGNYTPAHVLAVPDTDEAPDELAQRRIIQNSRKADRTRANEVILAAEDVRQAIRERAEQSPEFRKLASRSLYRIGAELDRVVKNAKRHVA